MMKPGYIARSRQDALDLLRGDGTPCNESRGWYGTKPGCKRKSQLEAVEKVKPEPRPPKKARTTVKAKTVKATGKANSRKKASEETKPATGVVVLDNYDRIKTDWAGGIKQGKLYVKLGEYDYDLKRNQDLTDGYKSETGNKFSWQGRTATKKQILADLESDRAAITQKRAAFAKKNKLDPNANTSRIFDALEVASSLKTEGRSKKIQKGAIEIDGTIAAAFSYEDTGKSLYVNYLGANPSDIIAGKSRGAGTAAIKALAQRSIDSGHGGALELQAKRGANSFYEGRGFSLTNRTENRYTLSAEAAQKLLGGK